ncbi:hypothetical protein [Streptomyces sp. NPDC093089]|uniref:hypothetical protein n=1 Tax=Streptomyces sp. NPDC093089 TaxID=3366024 RepID=UPI0037FA661E
MLLRWLIPAVAAGPYTVRPGEAAQAGQTAPLAEAGQTAPLAEAGQTAPLAAEAESARAARLLNPAGQGEPLPLAVIWTPRTQGEPITAGQQETVRQVTAHLAGPAAVPVLAADGQALTAVIAAGPTDRPTD